MIILHGNRRAARPAAATAATATLLWLALVCLSGCPDLEGADKKADAAASATDSAAAKDPDGGALASGDGAQSDGAQGDGTASGDGAQGDGAGKPPIPTTRVRIVAANLSSGKKQSWDPGHGKRIMQGLVADIILIQEFNIGNNTSDTLKAFVKAMCGDGFSYFRESGSMIPNGIISRFPILASGAWDDSLSKNREFAWARIDVPGPIDLWVVSLHLLTSKSTVRGKQIAELVMYIKQYVPEKDFLIVGGDLNTTNFSEQSLKGFDGLLDRTARPLDQKGNGHTNSTRNKPYDRLFADFDLQPHHTAVQIGKQSFPHGLVFDSRVFTPLVDVSPAQKDDSDAFAMQHMAVVRDFLLPTPKK